MSDRRSSIAKALPPYRLACVAHSADAALRRAGSSGGVITETLRVLLDSERVDGAIGVGFEPHAPIVPAYRMAKNAGEAVTLLQGSKYLRMTLDPLRRLIEANHDKRLAVTAQPCHIDAVKAYNHVAVGIAPFCGFNMEAAATPYLIARSGAAVDRIREIRYRGGPYPGGFVAVAENGAEYRLRKEHYECANLLFMAPPCFHCRRYIAPGADIAVGDAWIRGQPDCSLVIAMTAVGESIVRDLVAAGRIAAYAISREEIARMHAHNIRMKSRGPGLLLRCALRAGRMPGVRALAPFRLAGLASRMRRALTMGVAMRLRPLERQ